MASTLSNLAPDSSDEALSSPRTPAPSPPGTVSPRGTAIPDASAAAERRLKFIIESAPCGLLVVDASGQVLAANRTALSLHRIEDPTELIGKPLGTLIDDEQGERVVAFIGEVAGGLKRSITYPFTRANGDTRTFETNAVPLQKADGAAAVLMATWDVTEWKSAASARDELRTRYTALESERDSLNAALETARRAIVLADAGEREKIEQAVRQAQQEMQAALADLEHRHAQTSREWAVDREELTRKLCEAERREAALSGDIIAEHAAKQAASEDAEQQRQAATAAAARVASLEEEVLANRDAREALAGLRIEHERLTETLQDLNRAHAALAMERAAEHDAITAALRRETARCAQLTQEREEWRVLLAGILRTAKDASDQVQALFDKGTNLRLVTSGGSEASGDEPATTSATDEPGESEEEPSWRF